MVEKKRLKFPEGFLWGTATSSHQVEGNNTNNDWYYFELKEGNIKNNDRSGEAVKHYQFYKEDIELMKSIHQNAYRFSIEWSRIEPNKGEWDKNSIEHYKDVVKTINKNKMLPMVTLHHFSNPKWIADQGGWENEKTVDEFCEYVERIVEELIDDVVFWITINEPIVYIYHSYISGTFPAGKKSDIEAAKTVFLNMLEAHISSYEIIHDIAKEKNKFAQVGIAHNITLLEPYHPWNPLNRALTSYNDYILNELFLDSIFNGKVNVNLICKSFPFVENIDVQITENVRNMDFIGLNYYTRLFVKTLSPKKLFTNNKNPKNDIGWEIYPDGILLALRKLKKYNLPIYITENGVADSQDKIRSKFIVQHLQKVLQAIEEGIDVRGYFHWSLMDNFEWALGFKPRFGLFYVDYDTPNKERIKTESSMIYGMIAENNGLNDDLIEVYGKPI